VAGYAAQIGPEPAKASVGAKNACARGKCEQRIVRDSPPVGRLNQPKQPVSRITAPTRSGTIPIPINIDRYWNRAASGWSSDPAYGLLRLVQPPYGRRVSYDPLFAFPAGASIFRANRSLRRLRTYLGRVTRD